MDIPENVTDQATGDIPDVVSELPPEDTEAKPYFLSFSKYNEDMCELQSGIEKEQARHCLNLIKRIGTKFCSEADLHRIKATIKSVAPVGKYKELFKGLHEDVSLREFYLSEKSGESGRLFFYTLDSEKIFYFVAITGKHIPTDKK